MNGKHAQWCKLYLSLRDSCLLCVSGTGSHYVAQSGRPPPLGLLSDGNTGECLAGESVFLLHFYIYFVCALVCGWRATHE